MYNQYEIISTCLINQMYMIHIIFKHTMINNLHNCTKRFLD